MLMNCTIAAALWVYSLSLKHKLSEELIWGKVVYLLYKQIGHQRHNEDGAVWGSYNKLYLNI